MGKITQHRTQPSLARQLRSSEAPLLPSPVTPSDPPHPDLFLVWVPFAPSWPPIHMLLLIPGEEG